MDFALNDDQTMLQEQLRTAFSRLSPLARVRQHAAAEGGFAEDVWAGLCEAGIPGLLIPERFGGLDLGLLDAALVAEELGRHTVPAPFLGPVVAAPLAIGLAGSDEQRAYFLPLIAAGELRIASAISEATAGSRTGGGVTHRDGKLFGTSFFAVDVAGAHHILVADTDGRLHLVDAHARGLEITPLKTVDWTRSVATLTFDAVETSPLPGTTPDVLARVSAALRVVTAADLLGAATRMMEMAVDYAKVRQQFGRPIGSFQAVKHLCADMAAELEPGRALVWYAAHALDVDLPDGPLCSLHAKSYMADASRLAARNATEVHGGIGITDELGLHFWFKRVSFGGQVFGGAQRMRELAMREHLYPAAQPATGPVLERVLA